MQGQDAEPQRSAFQPDMGRDKPHTHRQLHTLLLKRPVTQALTVQGDSEGLSRRHWISVHHAEDEMVLQSINTKHSLTSGISLQKYQFCLH